MTTAVAEAAIEGPRLMTTVWLWWREAVEDHGAERVVTEDLSHRPTKLVVRDAALAARRHELK